MNNRFQKIKDHNNLIRDSYSGAIINNSPDYHKYKSNKRIKQQEKDQLLNHINNLESRLVKLESLIQKDK